jgi:hypothetical protein
VNCSIGPSTTYVTSLAVSFCCADLEDFCWSARYPGRSSRRPLVPYLSTGTPLEYRASFRRSRNCAWSNESGRISSLEVDRGSSFVRNRSHNKYDTGSAETDNLQNTEQTDRRDSELNPLSSVGAKRVESGGKERQIPRPFHSDYYFPPQRACRRSRQLGFPR